MTPPVGVAMYTVCSLLDCKIEEYVRESLPFVGAIVLLAMHTIGYAIFDLGTLCPWCMVTWAVTIPSFYAVTIHLLRSGVVPVPARVRKAAAGLMAWVPLMAILSYAVVVLLAQVQLNALPNIFQTIFG